MSDPRQELEELRRLEELERKAAGQAAAPAPAETRRERRDQPAKDFLDAASKASMVAGNMMFSPASAGNFLPQAVKDTVRDVAAGAVRGAGSIGSTILYPWDKAQDLYYGDRDPKLSDLVLDKKRPLSRNEERRAAIDAGLKELVGANPDSLAYKTGKFGGEVAGTAGVGGVLAKSLEAAKIAPSIVEAVRTGGMSSGGLEGVKGLLARSLGGGVTGGASAGLVNPEEAGDGIKTGAVLPLAMRLLKFGGDIGRNLVGGMTGAGEKALGAAYEAGKAGGTTGQIFRDNMRGKADPTAVVDDAQDALRKMRANKSADYVKNMAQVRNDKTVLDLQPVKQAVQNAIDDFTFNGVAKNPEVLKTLKEAQRRVDAWEKLDPAKFHTPEGLDALKQNLGSILEKLPFERSAQRSAVSRIYDSVKKQIEAQAPTYSKTMKEYEEASDLVRQIGGSLSVGKNASDDTILRKLQSVMRNNVNSNYGMRSKALEALQAAGGKDLTTPLAGQALNNWMPRGLQSASAPGLSLLAGQAGGIPAAAGAAALSSPRLMGEAAHLAGRADPIIEALRRQIYLGAPVVAAQD